VNQIPRNTIELCGIELAAISESQCSGGIIAALSEKRGGWVVTANLDHVRRLLKDPSYKDLCSGADLVVADGMPVVWAARIAGRPLPERVAGSSMVRTLSAAAAKAGRSIYLLGGDGDSCDRAAARLQQDYPGLIVAGAYSPPFGFEKDPEQMQAIRDRLIKSSPDIIYVALGSPKQERLIADLRNLLPAAWWLGVGISFSFVTGDVRRAPIWMQKMGLEWVHRLAQEPKRLAKRYLVHGIPFAAELFVRAALARFSGPGQGKNSSGG
jgi:N-acetylglucosaminyldiphosphoundecaprenol N-acetyl-beta-D-mannosaminyltransferase